MTSTHFQPHPRANKSRGSALIYVIALLGITSVGVITLQQLLFSSRHTLLREKERANLTQIGGTLQLQITNPEFLKASMGQKNNANNQMLSSCAGNEYMRDPEAPAKCRELPEGQEYYSFNMVQPQPNNDCIRPLAGGSEGPCLVAGEGVGYNFKGEIGDFSEKYPIRAEAYFKPHCTEEATQVPTRAAPPAVCAFAPTLELGYRLSPMEFLQNGEIKPGRAAPYPKETRFYLVPTSRLHPEQCNEGASISGYTSQGTILCHCRPPYFPNGKSTLRGPLCDLHRLRCPETTIMTGLSPEGEPTCASTSSSSLETPLRTWPEEVCFANFKTPDGSCDKKSLDCSRGPYGEEGGWIRDVQVKCDSGIRFKVQGGSCPDFLFSVAGGVGKMLNFDKAWNFLEKNTGPLGLVFGGLGAAFGWVSDLFSENEWHLTPISRAFCPNTINYRNCSTKFFGFTAFNAIVNTTSEAWQVMKAARDDTVGKYAPTYGLGDIGAPVGEMIPEDLNEVFFGSPGSFEYFSCPYVRCRYLATCQGYGAPGSSGGPGSDGGGTPKDEKKLTCAKSDLYQIDPMADEGSFKINDKGTNCSEMEKIMLQSTNCNSEIGEVSNEGTIVLGYCKYTGEIKGKCLNGEWIIDQSCACPHNILTPRECL